MLVSCMSIEDVIQQAVADLAAVLIEQQQYVATAESCTGGMVAQYLTGLAGSSAWFDRAFITYSNQAKQEMLFVPESVFVSEGAVSQACVEAMVAGCLRVPMIDVAVAVSGIAGPTGGSDAKPVGTVWFAWQHRQGYMHAQQYHFSGNRQQIRLQATLVAIQGLKVACQASELS